MTRPRLIAALIAPLIAALVACGDRRDAYFPSRATSRIGPWDVYLDTRLTTQERTWALSSLAQHLSLSVSIYGQPYAIRWSSRGITPRIFVYRGGVLNSPRRIGVLGYADFRAESIHVVLGFKATTPWACRAAHMLRNDPPDPWYANPSYRWPAVIAQEARLVAQLEAAR